MRVINSFGAMVFGNLPYIFGTFFDIRIFNSLWALVFWLSTIYF